MVSPPRTLDQPVGDSPASCEAGRGCTPCATLLLLEPVRREPQRAAGLSHRPYNVFGSAVGKLGFDLEGHPHFGTDQAGEVGENLVGDAARVPAHYWRKRPGRFASAVETFDPLDFLARLLMQVPGPKLHTVLYYGRYANVVRARSGDLTEETAGAEAPAGAIRRSLRLPAQEPEPMALRTRPQDAARRRMAAMQRAHRC